MINEWLTEYSKLKEQEKELKAKMAEVSGNLKQHLEENKLEEYSYGGLKITYKPSERSTVNEEKLIDTLKKIARKEKNADAKKEIKSAIKKVEAIDENVLEKLIYTGAVNAEMLEPCYESKITYTLRLGKAK